MTQSNLIETIQKALEAATPGEWKEYITMREVSVYDPTDTYPLAVLDFHNNMNDVKLIANAPTWLRALLEENKRLKEYVDTTNYNSEKIAMDHTRLEIELAAKDKVLEWYAGESAEFARAFHFGSVKSSIVLKARSILSQYRRTTDET